MYSEMALLAPALVAQGRRSMSSVLMVPKKDSATALSQQLPFLLMLGTMPWR